MGVFSAQNQRSVVPPGKSKLRIKVCKSVKQPKIFSVVYLACAVT